MEFTMRKHDRWLIPDVVHSVAPRWGLPTARERPNGTSRLPIITLLSYTWRQTLMRWKLEGGSRILNGRHDVWGRRTIGIGVSLDIVGWKGCSGSTMGKTARICPNFPSWIQRLVQIFLSVLQLCSALHQRRHIVIIMRL